MQISRPRLALALSASLLLHASCVLRSAGNQVVLQEGAWDSPTSAARVKHPESQPRPTDPRGSKGDDEDENRILRERWIEQMHRTAPGVDWRAIERANQDAARKKRNHTNGTLTFGVGAWEEVGSSNQAGHTRCAAFGPSRSGFRFLYVGSANGGLWRGPRDGSSWEPISDALFGGVDEVVVLTPASLILDDIVVMRRSNQLYRSDDAGVTWTVPSGLSALTEARRMLVLADGGETILVHGLANVGLGGSSRTAIYASTDAGQSFSLRWNSPTNWRGDLWSPRFGAGAGSDVYALQQGKLRKSTDGGHTFLLIGTIDATATSGSLQGSEAGAPTVYVALRDSGGSYAIHRSIDAGANWTNMGAPPDFWGSVSSLASFSTDPNRLFTGGLNGYRSSNGGANWSLVNTWSAYYGDPANKLHADLRGLSPIPDPDGLGFTDYLYVNTDGGTYVSTDYGLNVQNISLDGLGVGQFYTTHTSVLDANLIVGGTQDQGYQRGLKLASTGSGPSTPFNQLISGDYGHLTSSDGDHSYLFSTYPGFILIQTGESSPSLSTEDFPSGSSNLWLPPVVADPQDDDAFYFLGDHLWRYDRSGSNWNDTQHSSFDFAAGSGSYLSAMAFAPTNPSRVLAVNDAGRLFWSTDGASTWTEAQDSGPGSHYFYGNALAIHGSDSLKAVVGGSGYSGPGVKLTLDGGQTWSALSNGLPSTLVYDIAWAPDGSDDLYAATEAGAWKFDSSSGTWVDVMGNAAPATTYWSVESIVDGPIVRFGTYGRGIWDWLPDGSAASAVLFRDEFETGDYTAGNWVLSSTARCRVHANSANQGSFGARLKKGGQTGRPTWIERAVDSTGWPIVRLEYARRSINYESHEFLETEWFDGLLWHSVESSQDPSWAQVNFQLPLAAGNNAALKIRFRAVSKGQAERSEVDDVVVVGSL